MARALFDRHRYAVYVDVHDGPDTRPPVPFEALAPCHKKRWLDDADVILDAMREPSEGVLNETYHSDIFDMDSWKPKEIWQAMIDAIKAGK